MNESEENTVKDVPVEKQEQGGIVDAEIAQFIGVEIPSDQIAMLANRPIKWYESEITVGSYKFKKCFLKPFWKIES